MVITTTLTLSANAKPCTSRFGGHSAARRALKTPGVTLQNRVGRSARGAALVVKAGKFDPETMEVLGVPGVRVIPNSEQAAGLISGGQMNADGTVEGGEENIELELAWDPEGVLGDTPKDTDHIARRMALWAERGEEEDEEKKQEYLKLRAELEAFRESRMEELKKASESAEGVMNFLLDTEFNEIEFELTRCRPYLTEDFFSFVADVVENETDAAAKTKLQALLKLTRDYTAFMDANVKALAAPADRLRTLLQAKDKRATIMEMAGNNEIDTPLLALLQTNINTARQAEQEDAADFMQKMFDLMSKFNADAMAK